MKQRAYIAGKFHAQERLGKMALDLMSMKKVEVVSSWLNEPTGADPTLYAKIDMAEVLTADMLILDTLDDSNTGGRDVEYGIALANGKHLILIGPARNVFHRLAHEFYSDWDDFLARFQS